MVSPDVPQSSVDPVATPGDVTTAGVCPVCRTPAVEDSIECPDCHVRHHQECWVYNNGCGKYGLASAPATEKLTDLEVPPSFWGQDEKQCPSCGNLIQAAALRCRHCGAVFNTARPQQTTEFHASREFATDAPRMRRNIILLLVFGILPCTAALAGLVGGIWYFVNRQRLAQLPASQGALAKIGLGIAWGQTLLLAIVVILHTVVSE